MLKDEADRYLRSALRAWSTFADTIFALDDGSEDETPKILKADEDVILVEPIDEEGQAWGDEWRYRKQLFSFIWVNVDPGDVIFFLDGDMCPIQDPTEFFEQEQFDSFCFYLMDLWATDETHMTGQYARKRFDYREEPPFWTAHKHPRTWAVRRTEENVDEFEWAERGIHAGHLPSNWRMKQQRKNCIIPKNCSIAHYGYLDPVDQERKHELYMSVESQLRGAERDHAESIVDDAPRLRPLPFDVDEDLVLEKP